MIEIQNGIYTLKCYTPDDDSPYRGHVFVGDKCVCRPFDRFFNYHEKPIDLTGARYYQKLDGTLINVWWHDGWHITTKKSFCSPYNGTTYQEAISPLVPFNLLEPGWTYSFEFTSPYNRIVTPYTEDKLWLLQRRNNETCVEEVDLEGFENAPEILNPFEYFCTCSDFDEGVVARTETDKCKIKHQPYLEWHRKRFRDPLEMIVLGEFHDFQEFYPELTVVQEKWNKLLSSLVQYTNIKLDRKSLALSIANNPLRSVIFRLYDNKTPFVDTRHMVKILEATCL